jgi:hypothetical protein
MGDLRTGHAAKNTTGGTQRTNYNTRAHEIATITNSSGFLIRYILTPEDGRIGRKML